MKFSKDKFNKNASKTIKKLLSKHIDILDGIEVKFDEEFGEIEKYTVNGVFVIGFSYIKISETVCVEVEEVSEVEQ